MINNKPNVSDLLNDFYINVTSHIGVPDGSKENGTVSEIVEHHHSNGCQLYKLTRNLYQ